MDKVLFSFGHGYSAAALAARLIPQGWHVIGTTRSEDKMAAIAATGVEPVLWPGSDLGAVLREATHLLVSAGPDAKGDPVLNVMYDDIARIAPNLDWAGYLSTTGVYGDHQGNWVDEDTALAPSTKRGQLRVEAEAAWQSIPDLPLHIFRLAGIYGPGRGPFAKVLKGTARRIIKKNQVFSRIHVDDLAQAVALSMERPDAGAIYNLCDDDPAPPQDVISYAAELLGLPLPEAIDFDTADLTPMARSFYAESKKVRNDRIKRALAWQPKYPDYRSGLTAMLQHNT
ncbi:SDR family oxidoreductase [Sulfitobacter sp. F26204]|uniref:SDR family oxidoreductase n=1 Tax=Sulfitobacter sp. F26204 TaxID=2996014 RepID=UPI00225DD5C3|nr:SDR family oxidoreductase [Sulfitobacter sp. F26204]MCX7558353.1 SDR family oxidoreductase [Sulfitobacter sp. F26204]